MTKTEIDELDAIIERLQDALKTIKDGSVNVTIGVTDARKIINVLTGQVEALSQKEDVSFYINF